MIISHKHEFIFVKTTKTAGTSVEISLSRFCGMEDVITPIATRDEPIRQELGVGPRNWERRLRDYRLRDAVRVVRGRRARPRFRNHTPAQRIRDLIGRDVWDAYFKFCFVRNPWDRAISRYYWNIEKTGNHEDIDASLRSNDPNSNWAIYTIDDEVAMDFVGKYENLAEDLGEACSRIGIDFDGWLPRAKSTSRADRRHYREILTPEQAHYIEERCRREIELFDYRY